MRPNTSTARPASQSHSPAAGSYADQAYRGYIVASLLLATLVGFALGIHVSVSRLLGIGEPQRTLDLIQAHGQVQLLGFAGLFVIGMSLRLAPRFSGGKTVFSSLIPVILWLMVSSLLLRAIVMPFLTGDLHDAALLASSFGLLVAAACFFFITYGTVAVETRRSDASSPAFVAGSALLFVALAINAWADIQAIGEGSLGLPYLTDNAVLQLELLGFLLTFILGVATRSLPAMTGLPRPDRATRFATMCLAIVVGVLAASMLYLQYIAYETWVVDIVSVSVALTGLVMLQIVWLAGILRPAANRIRPASRPQLWLLRTAFGWLGVAGGISIVIGVSALWDSRLPTPSEFDAIRHALTTGLVTQLIVGMALMILPEFAVERQGANRQRWIAIGLAVLFNVAAVLRVAPALGSTAWSSNERNLAMAVAGTCAEVGMIVFAIAMFRVLRSSRQLNLLQ